MDNMSFRKQKKVAIAEANGVEILIMVVTRTSAERSVPMSWGFINCLLQPSRSRVVIHFEPCWDSSALLIWSTGCAPLIVMLLKQGLVKVYRTMPGYIPNQISTSPSSF